MNGQDYEVFAYQAAPEGTAKGVIHGIAIRCELHQRHPSLDSAARFL